ncbi:MAG: response regulator [Pseudomonadota bacterium]
MSSKKRILVVDDEKPNVIVLQAMLKSLGYLSESAADGYEALAKLNPGFDLVLLDVMMPDMDGFEVARRIREMPGAGTIPIIMVTILNSREDRLRAVEAGANDFITKPVDKLELRVRVSSMLKMKEAEDALRESEARYRMLVENSPVGIISCDLDGQITEINPAAVNLLDMPSGEDAETGNLLSNPYLVESGVSDAVRMCLESGRPGVNEFALKVNRRGHARAYLVAIRTIAGTVAGAQMVVEDISHYKRTEDMRLRSERLKALVEMAEGAGEHFNDALQVIAGGVQMAMSSLESRDYSSVRPYLEKIRGGADRAGQTVRLLHQFAHARSATDVSQWKVVDLGVIVAEAVERSSYWWKTKPAEIGIRVALETELADECFIEGEKEEIVELIVNLLKNAVEAIPAGGTIIVKTASEGDRVVLEIQDDGIGIPRSHIDKVGEPFWTTKPSHAGLGLAIGFGIVRRHLGTAAVTSKKGRGTTVHVRLPRVAPPTESQQIAALHPIGVGLNILLIQGDVDAGKTLQRQLRPAVGSITVSLSPREGLTQFEEKDFDAVLCAGDVEGMDVSEVVDTIRKISGNKTTAQPPIIVLNDPEKVLGGDETIAGSGADRVVTMPISGARLVEIVRDEISAKGTGIAFSGTLGSIDILEVTQLMLLSGQRLILEVEGREGMSGTLFLDGRGIRHAVVGDLEGEEALYRCMSFRGGSFTSMPWREPGKTTINKPGEYLLLEAARRRDETGRTSRG